jgi:vacuolar iron transporter family protein
MKVTEDEELRAMILKVQQDEINGHYTYLALANIVKDTTNKQTLQQIAADELRHYNTWASMSGQHIKPQKWLIWWFAFLARFLGFTFSIKKMEAGEKDGQSDYQILAQKIPQAQQILFDEEKHEGMLLQLLDEKRLRYAGAVVQGLNQALVELMAALAGLTLAFENSRIIALAGLIVGIASSLRMATVNFIEFRNDLRVNALQHSIFTGLGYFVTVLVLIAPFLQISDYMQALYLSICIAMVILFLFNYYLAVTREISFRKRFFEMSALCLGLSIMSFVLASLVRLLVGIGV